MDAPLSKGQPCKLDKPGVKEKLLSAIAKGATYNLACGYAGIAYQTMREWVKKGEALILLHEEQIDVHEHKRYYDFYCDLKRVESYAALKWLEKIDNAATVHWQAAAWKLERRHPDEYGRFEKATKDTSEEEMLRKAQDEVNRLKGDNNGQPYTVKD
jgi:transposase